MPKTYASPIFDSVREAASDLLDGGLMPKRTMRRFDELCLTPSQKLSPQQIRALREREGVSQAVFARYVGVTPGLVSQWERGEKSPSGPALKLLALIARKGLDAIA